MKTKTDIQDLPIEELRKSLTYLKYSGECGVCLRCKEWTDILSPCCGHGVSFEGSQLNADDLWADIEFELLKLSEKDDHVDDELNGN